jgi:hypothetical protein
MAVGRAGDGTYVGLDLHLLDDADLGAELAGFLHLPYVGVELAREPAFWREEVPGRNQPEHVFVLVDDLALAVLNPL